MLNFFLDNETIINFFSWAVMISAMLIDEKTFHRKIYFAIEVCATLAFSFCLLSVLINILNKGF
tara:strand:+ start:33406 stop:33597 length:192 start_codon:yes stop_codon:yes gene_type:complete